MFPVTPAQPDHGRGQRNSSQRARIEEAPTGRKGSYIFHPGFRKGTESGVFHPKVLLVMAQEKCRLVISSANLCPGHWYGITQSVWVCDFPRRGDQHVRGEEKDRTAKIRGEGLQELMALPPLPSHRAAVRFRPGLH